MISPVKKKVLNRKKMLFMHVSSDIQCSYKGSANV